MTSAKVLVVEDELICAGLIETVLSSEAYEVTIAEDCETGWQILQADNQQFEAILLDRHLPDMDGLEFLQKIKAVESLKNIPVIMETADADAASIRQGLLAGAYYYLIKPLQRDLLLSIVSAAISQCRNDKQLQDSVHLHGQTFCKHLQHGVFHYRTLQEAKQLAQTLSQTCMVPERVIVGLQELLINAVEHGNLGVTYADKTRLMLDNSWLQEVERRLALPELQQKFVEIQFERQHDKIVFTIKDHGQGFDWRKYLEFDPERVFDPHGRGIALAKMMSFDTLTYLGNGNTVQVSIFNT
ncbi:MAG: response regulator receiver protein [Methylomonas sp.]|nr:MAG: response regulator receiver protein [Methylomonas sp.]